MAPINKTFFGNFMGTYFISRQASHFQGPAGKMKMRQKKTFSLFFSFLLLFPKVHISDSIDPEKHKTHSLARK